MSGGLCLGVMRDLGVSPLYYSNIIPVFEARYNKITEKRFFDVDFSSLNGMQFKIINDQFYNNTINAINLKFEYAWYSGFYSLEGISDYVGMSVSNFADMRVNESFSNAALSFDNLSNIALTYTLFKKLNRPQKTKKFLGLIKFDRKEKNYLFAFKVGIPLYTLIYRQGYTNPGNSTANIEILFPGYELVGKFLTGLDTDISLTRLLKNGNGIKINYNWMAFSSGKNEINSLNFSQHSIMLGLSFKLN
ncbi:MAG: hypothetical protein C0596_06365 [Marinilabiliales bacterium]|nr:MAG: hypothetical protein C0596_06365 [Marinilabiliales bacterium]